MREKAVNALDLLFPKLSLTMRLRRRTKPGSRSEVATLLRYLSSSRAISHGAALDIGANSGLFTLAMSQKFAQVVAIEPNLERARFLQAAVPKNVRVLCAACGGDWAIAELNVPVNRRGQVFHSLGSLAKVDRSEFYPKSDSEIEIQKQLTAVVTIDAVTGLLSNPLSLIKIDVEGFEERVIDGAQKTLADHRPALFIEIERRHGGDRATIFSRVRDLGYACFAVNRGELIGCKTEADFAATEQTPQIVNFLFDPPNGEETLG
jgi:FkbM family methyltransferase